MKMNPAVLECNSYRTMNTNRYQNKELNWNELDDLKRLAVNGYAGIKVEYFSDS